MSTQTLSRYEIIEAMPADSTLVLHGRSWDEYEEVLKAVGENRGLRISYSEGTLQIITLSQEHEKYSDLIQDIVRLVSLRLRIRVLSFGSTTMKKQRKQKGLEPDYCFYVQTAQEIASKKHIDFNVDPPPDVAVEIDIHHDSLSKFSIYAALGVPEIWRYDERSLIIYHLVQGEYREALTSLALPMLTAELLSKFLARGRQGDQYQTLLAFEEWLNSQPV